MTTNLFEKTEIFSQDPTDRLERLERYPNFKSIVGNRDVKYFCLYMDNKTIHFQKRNLTDKVRRGIPLHGKEAMRFNRFRPNEINWSSVVTKFNKAADPSGRMNVDTRIGFKDGSDYLVKAHFTFGLRMVNDGQAHVVQTLNVPILFFLRTHHHKGKPFTNRYFPYESLCFYDRRILEAHTCYKIPAGTVYMLFTTQKNFFRIDVVDETFQIPFPHVDPVRVRVTRIEGMYDRPVPTPYIEDGEGPSEPPPAAAAQPQEAAQQQQQQQQHLEAFLNPENNFSDLLQFLGPAPEPPQAYLVIQNPLDHQAALSAPDTLTVYRATDPATLQDIATLQDPAAPVDPATISYPAPVDPASIPDPALVDPATISYPAPVDPATISYPAPVDPASIPDPAPDQAPATIPDQAPVDPATIPVLHLDRNVLVTSLDFVMGFQSLAAKRYDDPRVSSSVGTYDCGPHLPLDLSCYSDSNTNDLMSLDELMDFETTTPMCQEEVDKLMDDLCSPYVETY